MLLPAWKKKHIYLISDHIYDTHVVSVSCITMQSPFTKNYYIKHVAISPGPRFDPCSCEFDIDMSSVRYSPHSAVKLWPYEEGVIITTATAGAAIISGTVSTIK
jgi:hypothetical protein